jgi:hypothetical protein
MRMDAPYTEFDFDALSWHDCRIWGVEFRTGDADEDDWTSDLALEIDFILEWQCGTLGSAQFRIAPASLVFHGVTDPIVRIDWATSRLQVAPYDITIDCIRREPVPEHQVYLDRPYYSWRIMLNSPKEGIISFGAVGFTQTLRAAPILSRKHSLSLRQRIALIGR